MFLLLYREDSYLITLFSLHIINREFLFDSKLQTKVLNRLKIFDKQSALKIQIFTKHTIELIKLYSITNGKAVPSRNAKRRQRWRINKSKKDRKCICLLSFFNIGWKKATFPLLFSRETPPLQFLRNQRRNSLLLLLSLSLSS